MDKEVLKRALSMAYRYKADPEALLATYDDIQNKALMGIPTEKISNRHEDGKVSVIEVLADIALKAAQAKWSLVKDLMKLTEDQVTETQINIQVNLEKLEEDDQD